MLIAAFVKTVRGTRPQELAAVRGQLAAQHVPAAVVEGKPGEPPRDNFRRLLRAAAEADAEWVLHVEDDACLAPDFAPRATTLMASGVANVWTFYDARKESLEAMAAGRLYRRVSPGQFSNSQAVAFTPLLAGLMLDQLPEWEAGPGARHRSAVDYYIGWFVRRNRLILCASVPSLVQHREAKSLLGHRARYGRISRSFLAAYGETPSC